ncbi:MULTISPECIES: TRAP transporter substrate-binding protein DctP [Maritimibacter]|jgi:TRAP-type C4-dicarboxylate transport system substrate-binding protein|uniref:TRAP transporter substrate-binding protein DctP n=1 Tax=Maritimibacter dapengensis TaxID=2836868 RepID=A0ABS6T4Y9_9RHOB|nr:MULTISPECIES: TRAP transporter substrate-binding protein DctP [Maritimibacter]MBL6426719.1 TRAP transporter substrate-binding protein DctP [Maritimibacter sp.]MBV7379606.1 TRAP transporter substrate-binding protein DctP [Maritimibacter dapengensis]
MRFTTTISALAICAAGAASAQDVVELTYSDTVPETDPRSAILKAEFGDCLGDGFNFQPYHGATLFQQGTELTAMQRGNLDMGNLAIFDFYNQVPSTSVLGTPFLFRDYEHMRAVYDSDVLADLEAEIEEKAGVKILAYPYIGARHLGYKGDKEYMTPADLEGMKLRMPGGEGWQFVGQAMGATPVPVAFTEVYTALQSGAIDGQDNGFPATASMKFHEVINYIGTTSHLIAANEFTISLDKWNSMNEEQQAKVQECADNFEAALDASTLELEESKRAEIEAAGVTVYAPDNAAFQEHVLGVYADSKYSADWPEGLVEAIQAVGQ